MEYGNRSINIYELAKQMLADGFTGQGMHDQEKAEDYIYMAADNPDVESELPPSGLNFWKAANFRYTVWKARKKLGGTR